MTLIVEDGSGLSTAESYLSVSDADSYHTNFGNVVWTGATALKEAALRRATQYLDGYYRYQYRGVRTKQAQTLEWPRYDVVDASGYWVPSNALPNALKQATAEAALRELASPGSLQPDLARGGAIASEEVTAGPVSTKTSYRGDAAARTIYSKLDELLSGLCMSSLSQKMVRS